MINYNNRTEVVVEFIIDEITPRVVSGSRSDVLSYSTRNLEIQGAAIEHAQAKRSGSVINSTKPYSWSEYVLASDPNTSS
jgi:hypothetical protein